MGNSKVRPDTEPTAGLTHGHGERRMHKGGEREKSKDKGTRTQVQEMGRLHLRVHRDDETPPSP